MTVPLLLAGCVVVVVVLTAVLWALVTRYVGARGDRVVTCPDNGQEVGVRVDAVHAAVTPPGAVGQMRLESCSRWPEKANCGRDCLAQVAAQPEDCLVRTQLTRWYADKTCALCGKPFGDLDWSAHKPAVRSPEGVTTGWHDIRPNDLSHTLATHGPVCWDCHVAETFRRQRPELVIDNPHASAH